MKNGTKIMIILLAVVLIVGLLAGGLYLKSIRDYKAEVAALTFTEIDLSRVADGTYMGSCETGVVNAQVLVTVRDHTITDIQLLRHDNGRGSPAEAILDRMLHRCGHRQRGHVLQQGSAQSRGKRPVPGNLPGAAHRSHHRTVPLPHTGGSDRPLAPGRRRK